MENNIHYSLSVVNDNDFKAIRTLTEKEYQEYVGFTIALNQLFADESLFDIVELNYRELEQTISNYLILDEHLDLENLLLYTNRAILNFLSSIRMYLDHTETRIKRKYGDTSAEYEIFRQETTKSYNENFAYSFLYKLRNYTQHCGLPVESYSLSSEALDNGDISTTFGLLLKRDDLLNKYDSWSTVTEKLKLQSEEFDIIPLLRQKFSLLKKINIVTNASIYNNVKHMGRTLLELVLQAKDEPGEICLLKTIVLVKGLQLKVTYMPLIPISKITGTPINIGRRSYFAPFPKEQK